MLKAEEARAAWPRAAAPAEQLKPVGAAAPGRLLGGRYRIVGPLGVGGMGEVFEAIDETLKRPVAVKCLLALTVTDPDSVERFRNEVTATVKVDHANVVRALDQGLDEGRPYFVLERIQGTTLRHVLKTQGRLGIPRTLRIADQLLRALKAAHASGVVHRDLKPSNIMLADDGSGEDMVKIFDFGIAKIVTAVEQGITKQGVLVGTAGYMAPEYAANPMRPIDSQMDVYAVGVILFETLTGRAPWDGHKSPTSTLAAQASGSTPHIRDVVPTLPEALDRIVAKAMALSTTERYRTADELRAALVGDGDLADLPTGTIVDERYEILGRLGQGGMSVVYAARELGLDRRCALKFLFLETGEAGDSLLERFRRDPLFADRVQHPGVVRIHGLHAWRRRPYIAMELVAGVTLRVRWESLGWARLLDVLRQVADALDAVHAAGIVHRDVTPDNIMVDDAGRAKLLDFGIARDAASDLTRSSAAEIIGRYGYKSPEQTFKNRRVEAASDQWSLGAIAYEALAGQAPYCVGGEDHDPAAMEAYCARLTKALPPAAPHEENPAVPKQLSPVVLRALAFDPAARFPSARAFVDALAAVRAPDVPLAVSIPEGAGPSSQTDMAWSPVSTVAAGGSRRRAVVGGLGLAVLVAIGGLVAWRQVGSPDADSKAGETARSAAGADRRESAPPAPDTEGRVAAASPGAATPDAGPAVVELELDAEPAGAHAIVDGATLALPTRLSRPVGARVSARIEREGYESETIELAFERSGDRRVVPLTVVNARSVAKRRPAGRPAKPAKAADSDSATEDDDDESLYLGGGKPKGDGNKK